MAAWTPLQSWAARLNVATPPLRARALLDELGPDGLSRADAYEWAAACGAMPASAAAWRAAALAFDVEAEERLAGVLGARLLVRGQEGWPDLLEGLHDPPLVLYVQGALMHPSPVAIVGTRVPTQYGRRMARMLADGAARAGLAVVSGLARGIDGEAHAAALDAKGMTWAVLGGGLARVYPAEHAGLARRIVAQGGAVLSERPLRQSLYPELFPRRNRIIAGLSWLSVVVEGRHKSGAMITAKDSLAIGREVLAVPGPADSVMSEAPHSLLGDGARQASTVEDLLGALPEGQLRAAYKPLRAPVVRSAPAGPPPTGEEAALIALLGADALSLDELSGLSGLDTTRISSIMFGLEIKERVISVPGNRYAQKEAR